MSNRNNMKDVELEELEEEVANQATRSESSHKSVNGDIKNFVDYYASKPNDLIGILYL